MKFCCKSTKYSIKQDLVFLLRVESVLFPLSTMTQISILRHYKHKNTHQQYL